MGVVTRKAELASRLNDHGAEVCCLLPLPPGFVEVDDAFQRDSGARMRVAEVGFDNRITLEHQRLGLGVPLGGREAATEQTLDRRRLPMCVAKVLAAQRERLAIERLGARKVALPLQEIGQIVDKDAYDRMVVTEDLVIECQRLSERPLGLVESSAVPQQQREIVERRGDFEMLVAKHPPVD